MTVRRTSLRLWAALSGIVLGPLLPHSAAADPASRMPAQTVCYVGWHRLCDDPSRLHDALRAIVNSPFMRGELDERETATLHAMANFTHLAMKGRGAIAVLPAGIESEPPLLVGVVLMADDPAALAMAYDAVIMAAGRPERMDTHEIAGASFRSYESLEGPTLFWTTIEDVFLLAVEEAAAERFASHLRDGGASLAASDEYRLIMDKVGAANAAEREWSLTGVVDFGAMMRFLEEVDPDDGGEMDLVKRIMNLDAFGPWAWHFGPGPYGTHMTFYQRVSSMDKGIARLIRQKPLTDDDLRIVPKDAYYASVSNLDLASAWSDARDTLEDMGPAILANVDGAIAMATQFLGFSLTDHLLPALGDTWIILDAPAHGGVLFTGAVLVAEVRDAAALRGILERSVEVVAPLAELGNVRLTRKQMQSDGRTIHYLLVGGFPVPLAPAWTFVGDRWVFGLFPQSVSVAARQVDPATRGPSLLDHPDFQAARKLLPERYTALSYVDSRSGARLVYALRQLAETAIASMSVGSEYEFDLAGMPTYPQESEGLRSYVAVASYDDEGVLSRAVASSPLGAFVGGDGGILVAVGAAAMATAILLPSLARAREQAKRAVSASNLRGIGYGCHVYAANHDDRFPASLDELLDGGIIMRSMLTSPRDEEGRISYVYLGELYSSTGVDFNARNVLAYERVIGHEGTNVLFADGHVEWMHLVAFRDAVRGTYERLGRSDDLPGEFRE